MFGENTSQSNPRYPFSKTKMYTSRAWCGLVLSAMRTNSYSTATVYYRDHITPEDFILILLLIRYWSVHSLICTQDWIITSSPWNQTLWWKKCCRPLQSADISRDNNQPFNWLYINPALVRDIYEVVQMVNLREYNPTWWDRFRKFLSKLWYHFGTDVIYFESPTHLLITDNTIGQQCNK